MNLEDIQKIRNENEVVDGNMATEFLNLFSISDPKFASLSKSIKEVVQFNLQIENQANLATYYMSKEHAIFGYFLKVNELNFSSKEFLDYLFSNLSEMSQEKFLVFFFNLTNNNV